MRYRRLGRTNLNISVIAYGGLPSVFQPPQVVIEAINYALDQGINYFDLDEAATSLSRRRDIMNSYNEVLKERLNSDPATCRQCGQCVEKCPYNLPVPALMQRAVALFDEG